jgi:hypothetical protein
VPSTSFTFEVALDTETPTLQTVNYYFDGRNYPIWDGYGLEGKSQPQVGDIPNSFLVYEDGWIVIPGAFVTIPVAVTNPVIIAQVGKPVNLQCWSQLNAVRPNGMQITNQSCWIDQDFAQAYLCDPATGDVPRTNQLNYNGKFKIDTNTAVMTGILSPNLNYPQNQYEYECINAFRSADFTPTRTGKVIVTTVPDANGNYGEVTIYVIDMQVDANHDGVMDNRDLTSVNNPMVFWVNNDVDRWHTVDGTDSEQDSLQINDSSFASWQQVPDCQYVNGIGQYAIPCTRDLEDYARLWIPGLTNLMQVLPSGYGISLQWRNGTGAGIRIFGAADADGGTNYLFDGTTASNQVDTAWYPCLGYVTSNQPLVISAAAWQQLNGLPPSDHFIFCGTAAGNDELVLQVTNQYGGVVGEASVFLNLKDIKEMYERWTVGDTPGIAPNNIAVIATNDLPPGDAPFQYSYNASVDSETPYILYVHGWNMEPWEKDRYAETMYKRLYWQGYQGRFGSFRWPTDFDFSGIISVALDGDNYDLSETNAWASAVGLDNRLVALNIQYPGNVFVAAHSMGNIATGEALRKASATLVNTYVAMEGAVPAHCYDQTATFRTIPYLLDAGDPDCYANYWTNGAPCYFTNSIGAASYINFFNTNDWALGYWQVDQNLKPDSVLTYGYSSSTFTHTGRALYFPTNTYEIFSFCDQARCYAIGAQPNVGGAFLGRQVELDVAPYNFGPQHKYHSGQFRSDNMDRAVFWNQALVQMRLK